MRHFSIVKFNDSVNTQSLVKPIRKLFNQALEIVGVNKVEVYISNSNFTNRHDLMIEMQLTPMALEAFDNSIIHKTWKIEYGQYIKNKIIVDCD